MEEKKKSTGGKEKEKKGKVKEDNGWKKGKMKKKERVEKKNKRSASSAGLFWCVCMRLYVCVCMYVYIQGKNQKKIERERGNTKIAFPPSSSLAGEFLCECVYVLMI
jgi:hypothetical protein